MFYEITDTNAAMVETTTGDSHGFQPVYVVEAESADEALEAWAAQHNRATEGVTVKEVEQE